MLKQLLHRLRLLKQLLLKLSLLEKLKRLQRRLWLLKWRLFKLLLLQKRIKQLLHSLLEWLLSLPCSDPSPAAGIKPPEPMVLHRTVYINVGGGGKRAKKEDNHPAHLLKDEKVRRLARVKLSAGPKEVRSYVVNDMRTEEERKKDKKVKRRARYLRDKARKGKNPRGFALDNPRLKAHLIALQKYPPQSDTTMTKNNPKSDKKGKKGNQPPMNTKKIPAKKGTIDNQPKKMPQKGKISASRASRSTTLLDYRPLKDFYEWSYKPILQPLKAPLPNLFMPETTIGLQHIIAPL